MIQKKLDYFDLNQFEIQWLANLPLEPDLIRHYHIVPLFIKNDILHIGISNLTNHSILDTLAFHTNLKLHPITVDEDKLSQLINQHYTKNNLDYALQQNLVNQISREEPIFSVHENTVTYDEPLIKFTDNIIKQAIYKTASDIHIESYEHYSRIRYRQDGLLHEISQVPILLAERVITRLKILARLDIAERRLPQDGRFQFENYDIRISTCPTLHGEKIVLRLLNKGNMIHNLSSLGLLESQLNLFIKAISQPQGLILVTGPTGSGKTVTLYSALDYINSLHKNISTVEDPIEIQLKGINQVNIHPKIGLQFPTVLRALLRQDPDIIMIGEIRDKETAEIAMQSAQTGHLVFSTLHTNNAANAISRLQSMELSSYKIANSISLIVAQRLIRKLCNFCKKLDTNSFYVATGCEHCLNGYKGRIGIFELLPITEQISHSIQNLSDISCYMNPLNSLQHSGYEKVSSGITSLAEIHRVLENHESNTAWN